MSDERDDFWDLPEITPKKRAFSPSGAKTSPMDAVDVSFGSGNG